MNVNMSTLLALLILAVVPSPDTLRERFDVIEINHVFHVCEEDDSLKYHHQFTQALFLDFDWHRGTHVIEAWRMVQSSSDTKPRMWPVYCHAKGCWQMEFWDGEKLRSVEAGTFRETSADFDREVSERQLLPAERRRELRTAIQQRSK